MAKKNKIGAEYVILDRISEEAYPVPSSEWNKIKKIAKGAKCPTRWFGFFGSISVGVCTSSIFQFIVNCVQLGKFDNKDMHLYLFMVFLVISILLLLLDKERSKAIEEIGERIVAEMDDIEHKYKPTSDLEEKTESKNKFVYIS